MTRLLSIILILTLFPITVFALPPNDFEPWRMYATYENGYAAGKPADETVSQLQYCIEESDHSFWKDLGWNDKTIRKAELLWFYGCINTNHKKMTKKEFMKYMFKSMMDENSDKKIKTNKK